MSRDLKPKALCQMTAKEKIDLAANAAMSTFIQIGGSDFFITLATTAPEKFAALMTQLLRLQLDAERDAKGLVDGDNGPRKIEISFVSPPVDDESNKSE